LNSVERRFRDFLAILGYFNLQHGRPAKAAALFALLDVVTPGDPLIMKSLAAALVDAGQHEKALSVLDRLVSLGEETPAVHLLRAKALAAAGRTAQSQQAIEKYLAARQSSV